MQGKNLCFDDHICIACGEPCCCGTYTWACPWRNDDEDQLCGACYEEEYERQLAYYEGIDNEP